MRVLRRRNGQSLRPKVLPSACARIPSMLLDCVTSSSRIDRRQADFCISLGSAVPDSARPPRSIASGAMGVAPAVQQLLCEGAGRGERRRAPLSSETLLARLQSYRCHWQSQCPSSPADGALSPSPRHCPQAWSRSRGPASQAPPPRAIRTSADSSREWTGRSPRTRATRRLEARNARFKAEGWMEARTWLAEGKVGYAIAGEGGRA